MSGEPEFPEVSWVPADRNPWKVPVLDVRPVTQGMISTSRNPEAARNAVSYQRDDGRGFLDQEPVVPRSVDSPLRYRRDRLLADGVLFTPTTMEHKWALYHHDGEILCVRSWQRRVFVAAQVEQREDEVTVTAIHGTFSAEEDEPPAFTNRILDFLIRSHALGEVFPAPLPGGAEVSPREAALWCFSVFGSMAHAATPHEIQAPAPERPLRTHSLLHIAVARGDAAGVEAQLALGVPIDLPALDGLPPLHWAMSPAMQELLLSRGSAVDVRSTEGATALMTAVQADAREQVEWLLAHGADPKAADARGFTALHRAAEQGKEALVRTLLAAGADPDAGAQGHTPASLAESKGHRDIAELLRPGRRT